MKGEKKESSEKAETKVPMGDPDKRAFLKEQTK